jgi:hypothetical protein
MIARLLALAEGFMEIATKVGRRKIAAFVPPFFLAELVLAYALLFTEKVSAAQFIDGSSSIALTFGGILAAGNAFEHAPKVIEAMRRATPDGEGTQK